jgi:hypothetical protein
MIAKVFIDIFRAARPAICVTWLSNQTFGLLRCCAIMRSNKAVLPREIATDAAQ